MSSLSFAELFPRGTNCITELDTKITQYLEKGCFFEIKNNWNGTPIEEHDYIKITMKWHFERVSRNPHKRVICVEIHAPLFDDPEPEAPAGPCPGLWNFECVELFFANDKGHYLEVEVGPHGHWLVLLHRSYRNCFNNGEEIELEVQNTFKGSEWICNLEIPLAYLPGRLTKFNAYASHGEKDERHYESLYAITDGSKKTPDFHDLQYFGKIEVRRIIPDGYNRQPFNDIKYGNMWENVENDDN